MQFNRLENNRMTKKKKRTAVATEHAPFIKNSHLHFNINHVCFFRRLTHRMNNTAFVDRQFQ